MKLSNFFLGILFCEVIFVTFPVMQYSSKIFEYTTQHLSRIEIGIVANKAQLERIEKKLDELKK
jgi:hypothetical protein